MSRRERRLHSTAHPFPNYLRRADCELSVDPSLWILVACTIAFELFVLRRLGCDRLTTLIVLAGTLLCVHYMTYTSWDERNYDGALHAEYIRFLAERRRLPDPASCRFCTHPPLYYALAALFSEFARTVLGIPPRLGLPWFSLLSWFGFVVFALLIVRRSTNHPPTRWLLALLVAFWPSSIIHSVRVHNDALASSLMLAAIYWLAEWHGRGRSRDLHAALGCVTLALFTKASAYAIAATLVVFVLLRLFSKQEPRSVSVKRTAGVVLLLTLAGALAVWSRDSGRRHTLCGTVLGRACAGRYVPPVADSVGRFVAFQPRDFFERIDTVPTDPFLNRFLKSMLFGVQPLGEDFEGARYRVIAGVFGALLAVVLGVCLVGALKLRRASVQKYAVYLAAPIISFLFLVGFRVLAPNEFHEDFRHIFPALAMLCLGYAKTVERFGWSSRAWTYGGYSVAVAVAACSLVFFLRIG